MNNIERIFELIKKEEQRQNHGIELIASENIVSRNVMLAQGSCLTNKYAEGYPGKRYYGGCEVVDEIEIIAIERAKEIFACSYANVQPHSGSQANQAVFLALLSPGDTILSMSLNSGGHLTHGAKPNLSGKWFNIVHYEVDSESYLLDYEQVTALAKEHRPKLIIAGGSAYPRIIDFAKFRAIADEVGAYLMVDMAHFAGIVAAGLHPSPLPYADVVTSTTHKTLRGPRGGLILSNNQELAKKLNSGIFPGLQGGPLMHVIAAKAVAFEEILCSDFKAYIKAVLENAKVLAETLFNEGFDILTGGTDTHLMLVDLRSKNITGQLAENLLGEVGLICNKNAIPFDTVSPMITSGIRLGSPAATTRGFKAAEFRQIGGWIAHILNQADNETALAKAQKEVGEEVAKLCARYPLEFCCMA